MSRHLWSRAWVAWLAAVLGSFAVLEYEAFRRRKHPTLSRCLARWLGVAPRRRWGRVGPWLFVLAWAGLAVHVARIQADQ